MYDVLKEHVIKDVWCSPEQDNQVIVGAVRISKAFGEYKYLRLMGKMIKLPKDNKNYHIFHVGQAHPLTVGLLSLCKDWMVRDWIRFDEAVNKLQLYADLYTDDGIKLPLHNSYYLFTEDRALIYAVEIDERFKIRYERDQVYLRLYTNSYYGSVEGAGTIVDTETLGYLALNSGMIQDMKLRALGYHIQTVPSTFDYGTLSDCNGTVLYFHNGILKSVDDIFSARNDDRIEIVYDPSIKRIVDLPISSLYSYVSTLDSIHKYLLHYPGNYGNTIDFQDDIDVYIVHKSGESLYGRYLHKNLKTTLRNVTHRDYAISVDRVRSVAESIQNDLIDQVIDLRSLYVRLYIRKSGLTRPLVYDHNRLFEMYKMSDDKVVRAMIGVDSTVDVWKVDTLESSSYLKLMRADLRDIDMHLIEEGLGYNSISKYLGDSPVYGLRAINTNVYKIPPAMHERCTIFEYDAEGLLLEYHYLTGLLEYVSTNPLSVSAEFISGHGLTEAIDVMGTTDLEIRPKSSYRVYYANIVQGVRRNDWTDVTDQTTAYRIENNRLIWTRADEQYMLLVRTDYNFLVGETDLLYRDGVLTFNITEFVEHQRMNLEIPMGDLDIWMNGRSLINGLDYFVNDYKVVITNKSYLNQPSDIEKQKIVFRYTGFCTVKDGKLVSKEIEDKGFIVHKVLSNNSKYDIRDDKVLRITVDGKLKHREALIFSEMHHGVAIIDAINGLPYQVKEYIVPLRGMTNRDTYVLREKSLQVDKAVSDYMTLKVPQPPRDAVSGMFNRHLLVSPFFSSLINDLYHETFDMDQLNRSLSDQDILDICQPYEHHLDFDPITNSNGIDHRFVVIHPHAVDRVIPLSYLSYTFINRVAKLYAKNYVEMSGKLSMEQRP